MSQRTDISASIQLNFPDNASQFITPLRLRTEQGLFEQYVVLNEQTASIIAEAVASGSTPVGFVTTASFNAYTASTNTFTGSIQTQVNALQAATASYVPNAATSSMSITTLNVSQSFTASGLNYPTVDGLEFQFLETDGVGNLFFGDVHTIFETVYTGENITKSDPLYISGSQGANPIVYKADAANAAKMPVTFIASETIAAGNTTRGIVLGLIEGIDLTGYPAGTEVYVAEGGGWTSTRPTGSAIVQILGIVTKEGVGGKGLILNPGPVELPNLQAGYAWVGDSNGVPEQIPTSSFVFDTGSFATTGSNVFSGSQTFNTASIFLRASGSQPTFTNFTQSVSGVGGAYANILMFPSTAFSASVIFSGSRNIGTVQPINNTLATTQRGGGNYNSNFGIMATAYTTASAVPNLTNNFLASGVTVGIPNTSSVTTLNSNFVGGPIIVTGSATSNVSILQNNIDAAIVTNDFTGSGANQSVSVNANLIKGGTSQANYAQIKFAATQSNGNSRTFANNIMFGPSNIASLEASGAVSATSNLLNTAIIGSNLVVSGTMASNSLSASVFVGQFNETGSLADPSQIKFAVGAGVNTATRKTALAVSQSGLTLIRQGAELSGSTRMEGDVSINPTFGTTNATIIAAGNTTFTSSISSVVMASQIASLGGAYAGSSVTASLVAADFSGDLGGTQYSALIGNFDSTIRGSQQGLVAATSASFMSSSINSAIIAGAKVRIDGGNSTVALGRDAAYTASAAHTLYTQNIDASGSVNVTGSLFVNGTPITGGGGSTDTGSLLTTASVSLNTITFTKGDASTFAITVDTGSGGGGAAFPYTGSATISGSLQVNGTVDNTLATTVVGTGSIENRIHTKQTGAIAAGAVSSSAFISPEIGLEATSGNFKLILERNLTGSVGPSGSYAFSLDYINNVLVSGGTDSYVGIGKISGFCLPGRRPTTPFATASIQNYIQNDAGMSPSLSSSFDGTLYQVYAKHTGGASSSFAFTGVEFYHSSSTQ